MPSNMARTRDTQSPSRNTPLKTIDCFAWCLPHQKLMNGKDLMECMPPDIEAAKTISERGSIDQHVGLMAHFCEPALHQHHAYWKITQQEVIHIPPSCQVPPMALKCCQKVPLRSGLKITFCLHPFETCCQPFNIISSLAHIRSASLL